MKTKWKFKTKALENYRVGEDKKVYKMPFEGKNKRYINWHEVKKQHGNRYRLNGSWYTQKQLSALVEIDNEPIEICSELENVF